MSIPTEDFRVMFYDPAVGGGFYRIAPSDKDVYQLQSIRTSFRSWMVLNFHNRFGNVVMDNLVERPMRIGWIKADANQMPLSKEGLGGGWLDTSNKHAPQSIYDLAWTAPIQARLPISTHNVRAENYKDEWQGWYLVNETKKFYIDLSLYQERNRAKPSEFHSGWCVNPLPILTAIGGPSLSKAYDGGPDSVGIEDVGSWAFDLIRLTKARPDDSYLCETNYEFRVWHKKDLVNLDQN